MEQIQLFNPENVSEKEAEKYIIRKAARAIIFDKDGLVALLRSTKNNYYTLPGGGTDVNETTEGALKRECKEEAGCDIEIIKELGLTLEYRKRARKKHISSWYIAKVVGEKGDPNFEDYEIEEEGFELVWLGLPEAIEKVRESKPTIYEGLYMAPRDLFMLEMAKEISFVRGAKGKLWR